MNDRDYFRNGVRVAAALAAAVLGFRCQGPPPDPAVPDPTAEWTRPAPSRVAVSGRVVLAGAPPARERHELDDPMAAVAGAAEYVDETWLVGPEGGVANCVVTLEPLDGAASPPPGPLEPALYEKVGPRFEPRVLVVPVGTLSLIHI